MYGIANLDELLLVFQGHCIIAGDLCGRERRATVHIEFDKRVVQLPTLHAVHTRQQLARLSREELRTKTLKQLVIFIHICNGHGNTISRRVTCKSASKCASSPCCATKRSSSERSSTPARKSTSVSARRSSAGSSTPVYVFALMLNAVTSSV